MPWAAIARESSAAGIQGRRETTSWGLAQGRLHEHLEARQPARERVGPPQIEGKSRGDQQPFAVLGQAQREVVFDHAALRGLWHDDRAFEGERRGGRVVEVEEQLKDGRMREAAFGRERIDHPLEGHVAVPEPGLHDLVDGPGELCKSRLVRHAQAQRQGVHEGPHQPLVLEPRAPRDGRAEHEVGLARGAKKQRRVGREPHRKRRDAQAAREGLRRVDQLRREATGDARGA
jgi:hypothetical protein